MVIPVSPSRLSFIKGCSSHALTGFGGETSRLVSFGSARVEVHQPEGKTWTTIWWPSTPLKPKPPWRLKPHGAWRNQQTLRRKNGCATHRFTTSPKRSISFLRFSHGWVPFGLPLTGTAAASPFPCATHTASCAGPTSDSRAPRPLPTSITRSTCARRSLSTRPPPVSGMMALPLRIGFPTSGHSTSLALGLAATAGSLIRCVAP